MSNVTALSTPEPPATAPSHLEEAVARSVSRRQEQRRWLRPMRGAVLAIVIASVAVSAPRPGVTGVQLGVTLSMAAFVIALATIHYDRSRVWLAGPLAIMGAAGVTLAVLQPQAGAEVAASAAVFVCALYAPTRIAVAYGLAVTGGLVGAMAAAGVAASPAAATALLCLVLGVLGGLLQRSRFDADRAERLLAELRDARDAEAAAAAVAERARIARDLHDVLAHTLSGLSLQLEGARKLAEREAAGPALRETLERAAALAKDGLGDARRAVGALRGGDVAGIDRLPGLVAHYRDDLGLPVSLHVCGAPRALRPDAGIALYRAAGEALTNVVRHAPGASAEVTISYEDGAVVLSVEDRGGRGAVPTGGHGGGRWGLVGIAERVSLLAGHCEAGPTGTGWRVRVTVPS
jgi:signal transduction histidine kinase